MKDNEEKKFHPEEILFFKAGEKGFAVFWLLIGLFFTWQSFLLYKQSPGASSYGAVPLFCSGLIVLFSVLILITDFRKRSVNSGLPLKKAAQNAVAYLFNRDMLVMLLLVVLYCIALYLQVGFMLATPVFLWVGMTWLSRGGMLKNLIWTAIIMGFIYLVFKVLFQVMLP